MERHATAALSGDGAVPLAAEALRIRAGTRLLVDELTLQLQRGEFLAILGRNGSGKSRTLHTLAGLDAPAGGRVLLEGRPLQQLRRREIARRLGLLPQDREDSLALTALESVSLGRHPHLDFWRPDSAADLAVSRDALERVGLADCAARPLTTLSGGEQRRVAIAALLAQQPQVYLLDEPSNHLDPQHQIGILRLFRSLCDAGASVIATLHDPTLAARYADRVLLLHGDGRSQLGATAALVDGARLSELYQTPIGSHGVPPRQVFVAE
jgi:iron complex transport system ATP-binding protein